MSHAGARRLPQKWKWSKQYNKCENPRAARHGLTFRTNGVLERARRRRLVLVEVDDERVTPPPLGHDYRMHKLPALRCSPASFFFHVELASGGGINTFLIEQGGGDPGWRPAVWRRGYSTVVTWIFLDCGDMMGACGCRGRIRCPKVGLLYF